MSTIFYYFDNKFCFFNRLLVIVHTKSLNCYSFLEFGQFRPNNQNLLNKFVKYDYNGFAICCILTVFMIK